MKLRVFENFVFYPPYVKAKKLIGDGAIGEPPAVLSVHANRLFPRLFSRIVRNAKVI